MSIERTEQFIYFQNKAKHYDNIRKIKSKVDDKLSKSMRNTIDYSISKSKKYKEPHLKQYQIDFDNQNMMNRLINIVNSQRKQIAVQGNYSRYHNVARSFRQKSPYNQERNRQIQIQNQQIVNKLSTIKSKVGTNSQWANQYKEKFNHRQNLSRYPQSQKSKGSLQISTEKYIPQHYLNLIKSSRVEQKKQGETVTLIPKQKLLCLPHILSKQKSISVLERNKPSKNNID